MLQSGRRALLSLQESGWGVVFAPRFFASSSSATEPPPLTVQRLQGADTGIVVFRLNRPATRNAISKLLLNRLHEEVDAITTDRSARVLILKSDVPGAFCAGADLKERRTMPQEEVGAFVKRIRAFADKLSHLPVPTIAAIDGVALGGGLEFALACDMRYASATAKIGLTETRLAIIPGAGGCKRLPWLVGASRAKELIFSGRILDSLEAATAGLINGVAPAEAGPEAAYEKALSVAREIVPRGPIAVRLAKVLIDTAMRADDEVTNLMEEQCTAQLVLTKDRVEGLAAFNEKRPPVYKGE